MWYVIIFILVLLVDQVTKLLASYYALGVEGAKNPILTIIDGWLEITYVENRDGMMGLFDSLPSRDLIFLIATSVILLAIFIYLGVSKNRGKWRNFTLALILSGAFGNFIDRIINFSDGSYVRDMIHVIINIGGKEYFPYIFNVADMALVVGAIMLLLDVLFIDKDALFRSKKNKKKSKKGEENATEEVVDAIPVEEGTDNGNS